MAVATSLSAQNDTELDQRLVLVCVCVRVCVCMCAHDIPSVVLHKDTRDANPFVALS